MTCLSEASLQRLIMHTWRLPFCLLGRPLQTVSSPYNLSRHPEDCSAPAVCLCLQATGGGVGFN